jgi:hypothetical protein
MKYLKLWESWGKGFDNSNEDKSSWVNDIKLARNMNNEEELKRIASYIDDDFSWEEKSIDEVNIRLDSYIENEKIFKLLNSIKSLLSKLSRNGSISISAHGDVPKELEVKFTYPIFVSNDYNTVKNNYNFLKNSEKIWVEASPKVVDKWDVVYSGNVENNKGESIEFVDIDKGIASTIN